MMAIGNKMRREAAGPSSKIAKLSELTKSTNESAASVSGPQSNVHDQNQTNQQQKSQQHDSPIKRERLSKDDVHMMSSDYSIKSQNNERSSEDVLDTEAIFAQLAEVERVTI